MLGETQTQLSSEVLRRVDLENRMQSLKEQLDLQRNISDQVRQHARTHARACTSRFVTTRTCPSFTVTWNLGHLKQKMNQPAKH